jgi:hypothetical protein
VSFQEFALEGWISGHILVTLELKKTTNGKIFLTQSRFRVIIAKQF